MRLELFTFTISHFSEKARWGLDHAGVPYRERLLVPGPHLRVIRKMAPKSTVPVLRHGETCIQGSGAILDYAEQNLGVSWVALSPGDAARAKELEAKADVEVEPESLFVIDLGDPTQVGPHGARLLALLQSLDQAEPEPAPEPPSRGRSRRRVEPEPARTSPLGSTADSSVRTTVVPTARTGRPSARAWLVAAAAPSLTS